MESQKDNPHYFKKDLFIYNHNWIQYLCYVNDKLITRDSVCRKSESHVKLPIWQSSFQENYLASLLFYFQILDTLEPKYIQTNQNVYREMEFIKS